MRTRLLLVACCLLPAAGCGAGEAKPDRPVICASMSTLRNGWAFVP